MQVWLIIVVSFCVLYYIVPQKYVGWLFLATTLALSVMAFNCVPKETDDLSNYYWQLSFLRKSDWRTFQQMLKGNEHNWGSLPVCGYYFYFISKLGNNGFLPGITIFIVYGISFLIIYKASVRFKIGKWYLFCACLFFLVTYWFYDVCSGVRNGLAFTVFVACVYFDVVEKTHKPVCWFGYFICAGLHSSVIIMIMLRAALYLTRKTESKLMSWVMLISITIGGSVLQWLGTVSDNKYLQLLSEKADYNLNRGMDLDKTYIWVNTAVLLVVILLSLYLFKYIKAIDEYGDIAVFGKFYTLLLFFTAGSFISQLIYIRIIRWIIPVLGAMFFMIGMQACRNTQKSSENSRGTSVIRQRNGVLVGNEMIIMLLFLTFTAVHLWYACNGSSLIWLKFS